MDKRFETHGSDPWTHDWFKKMKCGPWRSKTASIVYSNRIRAIRPSFFARKKTRQIAKTVGGARRFLMQRTGLDDPFRGQVSNTPSPLQSKSPFRVGERMQLARFLSLSLSARPASFWKTHALAQATDIGLIVKENLRDNARVEKMLAECPAPASGSRIYLFLSLACASVFERASEKRALQTLSVFRATQADSKRAVTGHPLTKIHKDMERDFYLSAFEAVQYGLIDRVLIPPPKDVAPVNYYDNGMGIGPIGL